MLADWQSEFSSPEPLVTFGHVVLKIKSSGSGDENRLSVLGWDKYTSAVAEILALFFYGSWYESKMAEEESNNMLLRFLF